jgi:hypothetical protein
MTKFTLLFSMLISSPFVLAETTGQFKASPLAGPTLTATDLMNGARRLLPEASEDQLSNITSEAVQIRQNIKDILDQATDSEKSFKTFSESKMFLGSVVTRKVVFDSLYVRPGNHKSNQVYGIYIGPNDSRGCDYKYPTVLYVHHLDDDNAPEILSSKFMAAMEMLKKGVGVMNIYLPHYGPRKNAAGEIFVNGNLDRFKENVVQSILDIHLMRDWLSQQSYVDPTRISLFGISLGAMVNLIAAGIDPGFTGGISFMAGNKNIASLLDSVAKLKPNDPLAKSFTDHGWELEKSKLEIAAYDPILWAEGLKGTRVQFVSLQGDKLVPYESAVQPIVEQISTVRAPEINTISVATKNGGHRPDVDSIKAKLKLGLDIFIPLIKFVDNNSPFRSKNLCPGEKYDR